MGENEVENDLIVEEFVESVKSDLSSSLKATPRSSGFVFDYASEILRVCTLSLASANLSENKEAQKRATYVFSIASSMFLRSIFSVMGSNNAMLDAPELFVRQVVESMEASLHELRKKEVHYDS